MKHGAETGPVAPTGGGESPAAKAKKLENKIKNVKKPDKKNPDALQLLAKIDKGLQKRTKAKNVVKKKTTQKVADIVETTNQNPDVLDTVILPGDIVGTLGDAMQAMLKDGRIYEIILIFGEDKWSQKTNNILAEKALKFTGDGDANKGLKPTQRQVNYAIKQLQKFVGAKPDGKLGPKTFAALDKKAIKISEQKNKKERAA